MTSIQRSVKNGTRALVALLMLSSGQVFACKIMVKFPDHLPGVALNWTDAYHVVEIIEAHKDRLVGRTTNHLGAGASGEKLTFYFMLNEEPHAVCAVPYKVGETYLLHSIVRDERREISRFNWMNVPKDHERFQTYVEDLK